MSWRTALGRLFPLPVNKPELIVLGLYNRRPYLVPFPVLLRHAVIYGATGAGKSTFAINLAYQIAALPARHALALLDLKDSFCADFARVLPESRVDDCLFFDVADTAFPPAFNPLHAVSEAERTLCASELVSCLKRLFDDAWGPRLEYVLLMVLLTLLETPDATLLDITRILTEERYRTWAVAHISNFSVRQFWTSQFEAIVGRNGSTANVQSILNKLGVFSFPQVRNVIGQTSRGLDPRACMDRGTIVLINVPQGIVGESASNFLLALISSKFQLAAQSRVNLPSHARRPTVLVCDEFQNYTTASFDKAITEGRSMGLGIAALCQYPKQLSSALQQALGANCAYQLVCERRERDGRHFVAITPLRERDPATGQPPTFQADALPPLPHPDPARLARIRDRSRRLLARPRDAVEAEIHSRMQAGAGDTQPRTAQSHRPRRTSSKELAGAIPFFDEE